MCMTANLIIRKTHSTFEIMNCSNYSIKIILAPLKERITETNFFENIHTASERSTQTMDGCKISRQNKYGFFQKMDVFHITPERMDDCNCSVKLVN